MQPVPAGLYHLPIVLVKCTKICRNTNILIKMVLPTKCEENHRQYLEIIIFIPIIFGFLSILNTLELILLQWVKRNKIKFKHQK